MRRRPRAPTFAKTPVPDEFENASGDVLTFRGVRDFVEQRQELRGLSNVVEVHGLRGVDERGRLCFVHHPQAGGDGDGCEKQQDELERPMGAAGTLFESPALGEEFLCVGAGAHCPAST